MLPSKSFMKVGMILGEEPNSTTTSTSISINNYDSKEDTSTTSSKDQLMMLRIPSRGTLIIEGEITESKELTIDTVDIETFNEMYSFFSKRNYIYKLILFLLLLTNALAMYQVYKSKAKEKDLNISIEKINNEKKKLVEQVSVEGQERQERQCFHTSSSSTMNYHDPLSLFQVNNCYLNIQTTASLGPCAKDLQKSVGSWYEKVVYEAYFGWWENYFGSTDAGDEKSRHKDSYKKKNDIAKQQKTDIATTKSEVAGENNISILDDLIQFI